MQIVSADGVLGQRLDADVQGKVTIKPLAHDPEKFYLSWFTDIQVRIINQFALPKDPNEIIEGTRYRSTFSEGLPGDDFDVEVDHYPGKDNIDHSMRIIRPRGLAYNGTAPAIICGASFSLSYLHSCCSHDPVL